MSELKNTDEILKRHVSNSEGHTVGTVNEIYFDNDWKITDIQVKVDKAAAKQFGVKTPLLGSLLILIGTDRIQAFTDQVVIDISSAEFKSYVIARQDMEKAAKKKKKEGEKNAKKTES